MSGSWLKGFSYESLPPPHPLRPALGLRRPVAARRAHPERPAGPAAGRDAGPLACKARLAPGEPASGAPLAPLDPLHEVWAAGVTYLRSREARRAESAVASVYDLVYDAPRPELFFKAIGWRVIASGAPARIRRDSRWNVPEPELVLVINRQLEIVGYTAGNDLSSRDIEGENPLYLPQAKVYNGSCALGPAIQLAPRRRSWRPCPSGWKSCARAPCSSRARPAWPR